MSRCPRTTGLVDQPTQTDPYNIALSFTWCKWMVYLIGTEAHIHALNVLQLIVTWSHYAALSTATIAHKRSRDISAQTAYMTAFVIRECNRCIITCLQCDLWPQRFSFPILFACDAGWVIFLSENQQVKYEVFVETVWTSCVCCVLECGLQL